MALGTVSAAYTRVLREYAAVIGGVPVQLRDTSYEWLSLAGARALITANPVPTAGFITVSPVARGSATVSMTGFINSAMVQGGTRFVIGDDPQNVYIIQTSFAGTPGSHVVSIIPSTIKSYSYRPANFTMWPGVQYADLKRVGPTGEYHVIITETI